MEVNAFAHCCGVNEIGPLNTDPEQGLVDLFSSGDLDPDTAPAFFIFTDAARSGHGARGEALKDLIVERELGVVYRTDTALNKGSKNQVTVYVWKVNRKVLTAWWDKHPENPDREEEEEHEAPVKGQLPTPFHIAGRRRGK